MGYQITWKTKDLPELDSKFKTSWKDIDSLSANIQEAKLDFIITLLRYNKNTLFQQEYKVIKFKYMYYKHLLQEKWKVNLSERLKEEELWFYGWEYSRDEPIHSDDSEFESLCITVLTTKEADPIEDSSYFDEKSLKITELLESIEDYVIYELSHQFVDMYRKYQINDDEAN